MSSFSDMLGYLRKRGGLSQKELADKIGVSRSTIGMYEAGEREPSFETLEAFADIFNVSMDTLLGKTSSSYSYPPNARPMPEMVKIPRVGRIACGEPITAEENIEGYDQALKSWHADFSLICVGDSMSPKIENGDVVAIRKQNTVENGQIAAVRIGDEATLKMVFLHEDYIELRPVNPTYPSIIRRLEEMEEIRIEGKAVGLCRDL